MDLDSEDLQSLSKADGIAESISFFVSAFSYSEYELCGYRKIGQK